MLDTMRWCYLEEVAEIIDSMHQTPSYEVQGFPMVRASDVKSGFLDLSDCKRVNQEVFEEFTRKYKPRRGDVILSRVGSYFVSSYVDTDEQFCLGQNTVAIRPKINSRFLYYSLQAPYLQRQIYDVAVGTSQKTISLKNIKKLTLPVPSPQEVELISLLLGALDDKIEVNRRMNQTLEQMAQALFKSWFVDFDLVHANRNGEAMPGLAREVQALFPNAFEDSALGEIPQGWVLLPLLHLCEAIMSGGTPDTRKEDYWNGGVPWLSSGETRNRFIITTEKTITPLGIKESSTRMTRAGSTVIAGAGQGQTRGQTSLLLFDSYINQSVVAVVPNRNLTSDLYIFFDLVRRYEEFRQISDSHSSRGSLTTKLLGDVRVIRPPINLIAEFDKLSKPIVEMIQNNMVESRTLAATRDALLPKLLSGEVRVREAEKMIEEMM